MTTNRLRFGLLAGFGLPTLVAALTVLLWAMGYHPSRGVAVLLSALGLTGLLVAARAVRSLDSALAPFSPPGIQSMPPLETLPMDGIQTLDRGVGRDGGDADAPLERAGSVLESMARNFAGTAESARQLVVLAQQTQEAAGRGANDIEAIGQAIDAIQSSSCQIVKIVKSIDEIAFQTNILALNAALEAARAGHSGSGFAVVANEVRDLARRATAAARETASKIEDTVNWINQGAILRGEVAATFGAIVEKTEQLNVLVGGVAEGCRRDVDSLAGVQAAVLQAGREGCSSRTSDSVIRFTTQTRSGVRPRLGRTSRFTKALVAD